MYKIATHLILFLSVSWSLNLHATDVYKIVDENGRVQFSQFPPYKGAEKIKLQNHGNISQQKDAVNQESLRERQKKYSDYLTSERLERKDKREQIKQEKIQQVARCQEVQAKLFDMNQGGIVYYDLNEEGERVYIDEKRVQARKDQLKQYIDKNC